MKTVQLFGSITMSVSGFCKVVYANRKKLISIAGWTSLDIVCRDIRDRFHLSVAINVSHCRISNPQWPGEWFELDNIGLLYDGCQIQINVNPAIAVSVVEDTTDTTRAAVGDRICSKKPQMIQPNTLVNGIKYDTSVFPKIATERMSLYLLSSKYNNIEHCYV